MRDDSWDTPARGSKCTLLAINETIDSSQGSILSVIGTVEHDVRLDRSAEIDQRSENEARSGVCSVSQDA